MLFKGTQRRTARQIAETMDGVGGNLNAFTDKETTCYYAKVIDRHVPLALDVLADMFLRLALRRSRARQRAESRSRRDQDVRGLARRSRFTTSFCRRCGRARVLASRRSASPTPSSHLTPDDLRAPHARALRAELGHRRGRREHRARALRRARRRAVCVVRGLCAAPRRSGPSRLRRRTSGTRRANRHTSSWGRAASTFATSAVTRSRCSTRCSAAACRAASSRRYASNAASSTASTLSKPPIARRASSASTRERRPRTSSRASTSSSSSSLACGRLPIDEEESAPRQGAHQGQPHALAGVDVGPDDPPRPQRVRPRTPSHARRRSNSGSTR